MTAKAVTQGKSPAHEKQGEKRRLTASKNFGDMGRGRFRECDLDHSETADEGAQPACGLPVASGAGHPGGAAYLRGRLGIRAAVALRLRPLQVSRDPQPGHATRGTAGQGCRPAAGAVHRPRSAPHGLDAAQRGRIRDWIENCLAHEEGRSSRSIYNKAEYAEQRRHTLQEWANMADAWIDGQTYVPKLMPEKVVVPVWSAMA
jgi:hypothetical protein